MDLMDEMDRQTAPRTPHTDFSSDFPLPGQATTRPLDARMPQPTAYAALEPRTLWSVFGDLAKIPRPSFHEEKAADWVRAVAKKHGWTARTDKTGNVCVEVPASPGREKAPRVALQSHLDMVCIAAADVEKDWFLKNGIELIVDEREGLPIVRANGTTLGADNGIGVAAAFAAAMDPDVKHGPLDLVFTLNEESGMTGAMGLTADFFAARLLLNMDSEEDNTFTIGCAGACVVFLDHVLEQRPVAEDEVALDVRVHGLQGGHSGVDIHRGRANAIHVLTRMMSHPDFPPSARIASISGGTVRNAIPATTQAVIVGPASLTEMLPRVAAEMTLSVRHERLDGDPLGWVSVNPARGNARPTHAFSSDDSRKLIATISGVPFGPLAFDPVDHRLVDTSCNPGVVLDEPADGGKRKIRLEVSIRSLHHEKMVAMMDQVVAMAKAHIPAIEAKVGYPPWPPRREGKLLPAALATHKRVLGVDAHVQTIHAGLECGLMAKAIPDIEMLSFGPRIERAHSPEERVFIPSVQRFWTFLSGLLDDLSRS